MLKTDDCVNLWIHSYEEYLWGVGYVLDVIPVGCSALFDENSAYLHKRFKQLFVQDGRLMDSQSSNRRDSRLREQSADGQVQQWSVCHAPNAARCG